ncbi:TetR/AcrR family transcriptional regulator C-terminal domain-containing protein [uncultured Cellulomonas sp.]|uniref:TetR/AcrR family transcriptional regulator C-terminal domain-containing protein n=1 Tax=uncultured Cellulomonas sp. TaxID=189682 RepID=UPI0026121E18|nr:TetR/AcrR family transcriptional regulator C-terminal domain-containing protein [uncultured Cellulomonas sp.]
MTTTNARDAARAPLTRARVLEAAVALADRIGIEALTIRRLATELDVKPMALYHHVAGKEAILDGVVDLVFSEFDDPPPDQPWKDGMRHRCASAREVLRRHPWATPLLESRRSPGPATLHHHDAVLGCLRRGGLSWELTAHAYALLDAFVYGFALQEAALPSAGGAEMVDMADQMAQAFPAGQYPNLVDFTTQHVLKPGYAFGASFEVGLDLLLNGIDAAARR